MTPGDFSHPVAVTFDNFVAFVIIWAGTPSQILRHEPGHPGGTMSQTDAAASLPRLPAPHESRKAIFAAAIGNVLEWYDFGVYVFFASVIARNFFPPDDPAAALLASFAVSASAS
jgi:hypothetical protein